MAREIESSVGFFWTVGPYDTNCERCSKSHKAYIQFKTRVQRELPIARIGEEVDILDGVYPGMVDTSCENCPTIIRDIDVEVTNRILTIGARGPIRHRAAQRKTVRVAPEDILSPPLPRNPATIVEELLFNDAYPAIRDSALHSAVISPFPIVSLDFLKTAILYYDKLVLIQNPMGLVELGVSHLSDMLTHNDAFYSYVWRNFRLRPGIPTKTILDHLYGERRSGSGATPVGRGEAGWSIYKSMRSFEERVMDSFYSHVETLLDSEILLLHDAPRIQQQFALEWFQDYFGGPFNSILPSELLTAIYGAGFGLPFAGDIESPHPADTQLERVLSNVATAASRSDFVRTIVDRFAMQTIQVHLPSLELRTFDEVLNARERLRNELVAFREKMQDLGVEITSSWDWLRLRREDVRPLVEQRFTGVVRDVEAKAKAVKIKVVRDIAFSAAASASSLVITVQLGLPYWSGLLIGGATLSLSILKAIAEGLYELGRSANSSHIACLWKLHKYL